jgi:DNA-directed RNA polymerase specialized sigma24 family protein
MDNPKEERNMEREKMSLCEMYQDVAPQIGRHKNMDLDLLHDAVIRCMEKPDEIRDVFAYLKSAAKRKVKTSKGIPFAEVNESDMENLVEDWEQIATLGLAHAEIVATMEKNAENKNKKKGKLTSQDIECLKSYWQGESLADMAKRLGISPQAARAKVQRAQRIADHACAGLYIDPLAMGIYWGHPDPITDDLSDYVTPALSCPYPSDVTGYGHAPMTGTISDSRSDIPDGSSALAYALWSNAHNEIEQSRALHLARANKIAEAKHNGRVRYTRRMTDKALTRIASEISL